VISIGLVAMGVDDMDRAVAFWGAALGYLPADGEASPTWTTLRPASGPGVHLGLELSESPVQRRPRVHLDLYAADADEQEGEIARLVGLGGARADWDLYPADPDFVVMADTEGNLFCVIDLAHG
jgi:catechol 2,3-dioxygenase-like lactoylglutathione lyase family enzyme